MNRKKYLKFPFLTNVVMGCGTIREPDGANARNKLSSYAVCLLKEIFVIFYVGNCLRMTKLSRKSETFLKDEY